MFWQAKSKMIKNESITRTVRAGMIAALYVALTLAVAPVGFGSLQFRPSEALTILPLYFPEAIPALFVGCLISNIVSAYGIADILFGSAATLIAAYLTSRARNKYTAPIPSVIINALVIGVMISVMSVPEGGEAFWTTLCVNILSLAVSQGCVCYLLGVPLATAIEKHGKKINNNIKRK